MCTICRLSSLIAVLLCGCVSASSETMADSGRVFDVDAVARAPELLSCHGYQEPPAGSMFENRSRVMFVVNAEGTVEPGSLRVLGVARGAESINEWAVETARTCLFRPGRDPEGVPVRVRLTKTFALESTRGPAPMRQPPVGVPEPPLPGPEPTRPDAVQSK